MSDSESASDDGDAEDRMRDLLASYYGMQDKGEQGQDAGSNSTQSHHTKGNNSTNNSQSIDDISFEPKQYVRHLLKTSPLDVLLRRNDELVHEVKALDSDMQMLVYEVSKLYIVPFLQMSSFFYSPRCCQLAS